MMVLALDSYSEADGIAAGITAGAVEVHSALVAVEAAAVGSLAMAVMQANQAINMVLASQDLVQDLVQDL